MLDDRYGIAMEHHMKRIGTQSSKWDCLPIDDTLPYIALSVADMDFPCSDAIRRAMIKRAELGLYGYTDLPADHEEVVSRWLAHTHGWDVAPENIVSAHRIVQVVSLLVARLTNMGDGVALFSPSYSPLERAISLNDRTVNHIDLKLEDGKYTLDRAEAEKILSHSRALLLINPHNPTGKVWTEDELSWIASTCRKYDLFIMTDDIHAEFVNEGHVHTFIASLPDATDRAFTFTSPAKAFNIPGLETTHVTVHNEHLRNALKSELDRAGFHNPSFFSDVATRAAYEQSAEWLAAVRGQIQQNIDATRRFCEKTPGLTMIEPEGTYLVWIDARATGLTEDEIHEHWYENCHVVPSLGTSFGPKYGGFIRLNVATEASALAEVFDRLTNPWTPSRRRRRTPLRPQFERTTT